MQLNEFVAIQKQLIDDFAASYERRRKRKTLTLFRPEEEWNELLNEHKEIYSDGESDRTPGRAPQVQS